MTIDEFIAGSLATLLAFKTATLEQAKTDNSFALERDEIDWWREVAAYMMYTELEETFKQHGAN